MKTALFLSLIAKMLDPSLNVAQRNSACYELRGVIEPEVISAMRKALGDGKVCACAATNLRKAGAVDELKDALADSDFEVRAIAARELGGFENPEFLPLLAGAARDPQLLVAINAVEGLSNYRDPIVLPYLLDLAKNGGLVGAAALRRAEAFTGSSEAPRVLAVARGLLSSSDVSDKLIAMQVIGDRGDETDIPKLREIQKKEIGAVSTAGRGFGFIPPISLSRAAQTAIDQVKAHY